MSLRISLVNFLNAAPLGWYFLHGPRRQEFQVLRASPAQCAEQLACGEADIGTIPVIEYQRIPDLEVIPDVAIAASNEVRSVLLVRRRDCGSIRSVALDTSSRTAAALVRLLLQYRMGIHPEFVPHEPRINEMLRKHDAALLIGDAALRCSPSEYDIMDLAAAWRDWQKKPFVFAFWACRNHAALPERLVETFVEAKDWGLERIEEIAACYARTLNLPVDFLEGYLRHNLDHHMTEEHREGLDQFYRLSREAGFIEKFQPVRYVSRK